MAAKKDYSGLATLPDKASDLEARFWNTWLQLYPQYPLRCQFSDIEGWHEALILRKVEKPRSRMWQADFAYPPAKLIIEINGGTFSRGNSGHSSGTGISRDCQKVLWAAVSGWTTVSLTTDAMALKRLHGNVDLIARCLETRLQSSQSSTPWNH